MFNRSEEISICRLLYVFFSKYSSTNGRDVRNVRPRGPQNCVDQIHTESKPLLDVTHQPLKDGHNRLHVALAKISSSTCIIDWKYIFCSLSVVIDGSYASCRMQLHSVGVSAKLQQSNVIVTV
ncbi:uncharacterized protein LOC119766899 [Culex quinquefasciatus]|uniref:uncharacterized protein LOC119765194 n=1 Tax=Culex quinquefasciatus TaxID=7176 RepID=UPI0018E303D6|nr:uncharacterized protein LOC119765194 [Culex quinquefasciatus]XP_038109266.1 uncharacterized protein LOC119766899 [Culex quinquefasciatus]